MASGNLNIPEAPAIDGARPLHSGKVRDLYELPDGNLLMVASDRISAFDYVLETAIPDKGEILTRMSLWWFDQLSGLVQNHVVSTDVPDVRPRPGGGVRAAGHVPRRVRRPRLPDRLGPRRLPDVRRGVRHRAPRRAAGRQPPVRADLHPGDEGRARRPRRERRLSSPWPRRSATTPPRSCGCSPSRSTARPRRSRASRASSWPTRSSSSAAGPTTRPCSPTRC